MATIAPAAPRPLKQNRGSGEDFVSRVKSSVTAWLYILPAEGGEPRDRREELRGLVHGVEGLLGGEVVEVDPAVAGGPGEVRPGPARHLSLPR